MSDKKITELPLASAVNASDVSVLVNNGTDYQFAFSSLLQLIGSSLNVGASISFGTTLPQNTTGKNGDVFINTSTGSFAQKTSGAWTVVYTLPSSAGTTDGTVLYGIGVPGSITGNNNDTYINTGTGIFYKKTAGTWNQVFSMQTGPAGAPGAPGTNGANGTNGFSILNGTGNPSNLSIGVDGDFYINTATYALFGPKTSGNWGSGISLIGNGVPIGGTAGQVMSKSSDDNFDIEWMDRFDGLDKDTITYALGFTPEDINNKGVANGYASLDGTGKVPSSQLPSYVDDVIEVINFSSLPVAGETGKIYITLDTNFEYRWSGSTYVRLVASPGSTDALAEGIINLYFTPDRARNANSATSPIFYNAATGVISSQPASSLQPGYLTSTDWSTFNNKQNALSGTGYVKSTAGVLSYDTNTYNSGAGTAGYITKYSAANTQTQTAAPIYETQGRIGIGHITPASGTLVHISSGATMPFRVSTSASDVAQFIANNNYGGFRVATVGSGGPGAGVPYIALATGAAADGTTLGTQRAYFAYNQNVANTASLGYGTGTDVLSFITSGTGVGNVLIGSNTNNSASNKLQITGSVGITSLTASQPVFSDANKTLVSMAVVPAVNGGAGTINGLLKANGSGLVSEAVAGVDYLPVNNPTFTGTITGGVFNGVGTGLIGTASSLKSGDTFRWQNLEADFDFYTTDELYGFIGIESLGSSGGKARVYQVGEVLSQLNLLGGPFLPLTAGITKPLNGTLYGPSAQFGDNDLSGLIIGSYADTGLDLGAIYYSGITPTAQNYSLLTDGSSTTINAIDNVQIGIKTSAGITSGAKFLYITSAGASFTYSVPLHFNDDAGDTDSRRRRFNNKSDGTFSLQQTTTNSGSTFEDIISITNSGDSYFSGKIGVIAGCYVQFEAVPGSGPQEQDRAWRIRTNHIDYGDFIIQHSLNNSGTGPSDDFADAVLIKNTGKVILSDDIEFLKNGAAIISRSPNGTYYKLVAPNGGGAATWVDA